MKQKRTKQEAVCEALERQKKLEAIAMNTERKYGRVSNRLAEQLLDAQIDYAVAKDDLHDPFLKDD